MKLPKVLDRIRSIYRLTARKHKMDAERTVIKQKMNASINGSFFVQATPRKSRPVPRYVYVCIHTVLCVSEIYSWHMFVVVIDILFVFQVRTGLGSQKGQAKRYCGPSQGHSNGGKHTLHCVVNRQAFKSWFGISFFLTLRKYCFMYCLKTFFFDNTFPCFHV